MARLRAYTLSLPFFPTLTLALQPVLRRILTRLLGLIPAFIVTTALGRAGIDMLLVLSQVVLSIVLPFVILPLIYLSSSPAVMSVERAPADADAARRAEKELPVIGDEKFALDGRAATPPPPVDVLQEDDDLDAVEVSTVELELPELEDADQHTDEDAAQSDAGTVPPATAAAAGRVDYSNGWLLTGLGYLFWLVVVVANVYALVELGLGNAVS